MDTLALTRATQMVLRIAGVLALLLGIAFWTGQFLAATPLHMLLGVLVVLSLWLLAALAWNRAHAGGPAILGLVLGFLVLWVGYSQASLLTGPNHWLIQLVHVVLGLAAIGLGEMLGSLIRGTGGLAQAPTASA